MNINNDIIYSTFDKDFFLEKEIDGFEVTKKLQKIKAIEIDLLRNFDKVCKKHKIKYILWAGTLLGAIRHHGFIPWDDDLDVCLNRQEFEKLLEISKDEFEDPYFFQTYETDRKFFFPYARLRNSNTTGIIKCDYSSNYNNGIYIDIFVLDGFPMNDKEYLCFMKKNDFLLRMVKLFDNKESYDKNIIKNIIKSIIKNLLNRDYFIEKYISNIKKYSISNKIGLVTHGKDLCKKYWCFSQDFYETTCIDYYDIKVSIPKEYDKILSNMYGNYMRLPPVEERGKWHDDSIIFDPDIPYKEYMKKNDVYEK